MPIVDRREFGGRFSVVENAQRLANYRYLEIQLMEMLGGWSHTTPELAFKATFGYHVYDHAQAADLLGERLEQLRSGRYREEPATDDFARLCEFVWNLQSTSDRLVAVYRVLEPHLVGAYVYHADATDPIADTPTVRLLRQLAGFAQSHVAWGQAVLESLLREPQDRARAAQLQAEIEARLVASGGVTGQGVESHWLTFRSAKDQEKAPRRVTRGRSGYRFVKRCPDIEHPLVEAPFYFSGDLEEFRRAYHTDDEWSEEGFKHKFHQLLYGEVETTDRMGKMIAEFPELPWEMRMELAHQMWDEARHIEVVGKACEDLGGQLGYGPWPLVWWWMQNERDPLKRIAVNNAWAEANLMHTLRVWRTNAEQRGLTRIAELADYLQADELTHVRLATRWVRALTENDPAHREEIVRWGIEAVRRLRSYYAAVNRAIPEDDDIRFTFLRSDEEELLTGAAAQTSQIIGE